MDALQAVRIVPAVQTLAGTANPAPTGADAGAEATSPLFGKMFDRAATAVASRGALLHLARGAAVRQDPIPGEPGEAARPASQGREQAAPVQASGEAKAQSPQDQEGLPAAPEKELEASAGDGPLWVLPVQPLTVKLQPSVQAGLSVTGGSEKGVDPVVIAGTGEGATLPAAALQVGAEPPADAPAKAGQAFVPVQEASAERNPAPTRVAAQEQAPVKHASESKAGDDAGTTDKLSVERAALPSFLEPGGVEAEQATLETLRGHEAGNGVKDGEEGMSPLHAREVKAEVKGETVLRQAAVGVAAANPGHAGGTGVASRRYDTETPGAGAEPAERSGPAAARVQTEPAPEPATADAVGGLSGGKESFSSPGGSPQRQETGFGEGSHPFPGHAGGIGSAEASVRGEEGTRTGRVFGEERERLHQEILSQVKERLEIPGQVSGDSRMTLRLNPSELGELQLNVRMDDRRMSVEVTAGNPLVKEALLQNLDQLKETLSRQNIQMERFEVATGTGREGAGESFREGRQSGNRQGGDVPYPTSGYFREEAAAVPVSGWESREHSLVDMRF